MLRGNFLISGYRFPRCYPRTATDKRVIIRGTPRAKFFAAGSAVVYHGQNCFVLGCPWLSMDSRGRTSTFLRGTTDDIVSVESAVVDRGQNSTMIYMITRLLVAVRMFGYVQTAAEATDSFLEMTKVDRT